MILCILYFILLIGNINIKINILIFYVLEKRVQFAMADKIILQKMVTRKLKSGIRLLQLVTETGGI